MTSPVRRRPTSLDAVSPDSSPPDPSPLDSSPPDPSPPDPSPLDPSPLDTAPAGPVPVVLALGSNLGDRAATLASAVAALSCVPHLVVETVSPVVESDPVGGPEQGPYLNAVVLARTTSSPAELLRQCQRVEAGHGRERLVRWGARTLDVDIVCYGALVVDTDALTLPHPRARDRAFVLVPWALADPSAELPGPGGGTVGRLAQAAPDRDGVHSWAAP